MRPFVNFFCLRAEQVCRFLFLYLALFWMIVLLSFLFVINHSVWRWEKKRFQMIFGRYSPALKIENGFWMNYFPHFTMSASRVIFLRFSPPPQKLMKKRIKKAFRRHKKFILKRWQRFLYGLPIRSLFVDNSEQGIVALLMEKRQ